MKFCKPCQSQRVSKSSGKYIYIYIKAKLKQQNFEPSLCNIFHQFSSKMESTKIEAGVQQIVFIKVNIGFHVQEQIDGKFFKYFKKMETFVASSLATFNSKICYNKIYYISNKFVLTILSYCDKLILDCSKRSQGNLIKYCCYFE